MLYEAADQGQRKNMANFIFLFFIYSVLAALGLVLVSARGLSLVAASQGYSLGAVCTFSPWWLLLLWSKGSRACGHQSYDTQALGHRLSSCGTRGQFPRGLWNLLWAGRSNPVPCIGRRTLNHWATREVQNITNFKFKNFIENLGAVLPTVD